MVKIDWINQSYESILLLACVRVPGEQCVDVTIVIIEVDLTTEQLVVSTL